MTNKAKETQELQGRYGHLLDKYLEPNYGRGKTQEQLNEEAEKKYGGLLKYVKPDLSVLEHVAKLEDMHIENRRKAAEEAELERLRTQERIASAKRREQERRDNNSRMVTSIMERKKAKEEAAAEKVAEERREAAKQQELYDRIDYLININPETAEAYIKALKKGNVI